MQAPTDRPILLFDGVCNLCNGLVQWIIKQDHKEIFRFTSLQSEAGRALLLRAGLRPDAMDTVVLYDQGRAYVKSDAALRIAARLDRPWSWLAIFGNLPRGWRDPLYDYVARNRYRWFGRREACMVPTPALRSRFL